MVDIVDQTTEINQNIVIEPETNDDVIFDGMVGIETFEADFNQIDTLFKEADQARAYINITTQYGPSEQLLAFINYDNSLEADIGIEKFDSFTLGTRHEILLSKLDPDKLDLMATESLDTVIDKIGNSLIIGGLFGMGVGIGAKSLKFGALGYAAILAGGIIEFTNRKINKHPIKYSMFSDIEKSFPEVQKMEKLIADSLPKDFEENSWKVYFDKIQQLHYEKDEELFDTNFGDYDEKITSPLENSGWNVSTFKSAVKWYVDNLKDVHESAEKYNQKLEAIKSWASKNKDKDSTKVKKYITKSLSKYVEVFSMSRKALNRAKKIIDTAAVHFETTK